MLRTRFSLLWIAIYWLVFIPSLKAQTLQVIDADGHSSAFTRAQVAAMPHKTVDARDHDIPAQFEGVPLATLLSAAGIQLGDKLRGPRMADALLIEAMDGYRVVFALAECDPAFAQREIILADKRGGKPLDEKEGPFRIVAPDDNRRARWVRQVTTLKIVPVK